MRPTLQNGDVWDDSLANASGFPKPDGEDEFGSGPKVLDDWLDDSPGQIKANFYGWYNRIQITAASGRTVEWTGAEVVLGDGSVVAIAPGSLPLDASSSGFVVVGETGAVISVAAIPPTCIPLAAWATDASTVTSLTDLRSQRRERVGPVAIEDGVALDVGDIKMSLRSAPTPGYLRCLGQRYNATEYPLLFAAIGTAYNQPGDPASTFRLPDARQRSPLGADATLAALTLGKSGGSAVTQLTTAHLPTHSHGVVDNGHNHNVTQSQHSHGINDPGHTHGLDSRILTENVPGPGFGGRTSGLSAPLPNVNGAVTGISVNPASTNVALASASSGVSIRPEGGNQPIFTQSPFFTVHFDIRAF